MVVSIIFGKPPIVCQTLAAYFLLFLIVETFTKQCFSLKIPAFLGVWFTNERKIIIPEEQLPKMVGAEKRILKKALRAETIVSLPPLASSDDI